jgi:hypothetical protein
MPGLESSRNHQFPMRTMWNIRKEAATSSYTGISHALERLPPFECWVPRCPAHFAEPLEESPGGASLRTPRRRFVPALLPSGPSHLPPRSWRTNERETERAREPPTDRPIDRPSKSERRRNRVRERGRVSGSEHRPPQRRGEGEAGALGPLGTPEWPKEGPLRFFGLTKAPHLSARHPLPLDCKASAASVDVEIPWWERHTSETDRERERERERERVCVNRVEKWR